MTRSRTQSQQRYWHSPEQQAEHRFTTLEIATEDHSERLDEHEERHDSQDVWNKGFSVALAGLAAGLAHAKADGLAEFLAAFFKALKP